MIAKWNDVVIADSKDTVVVEGNHYFPASSVRQDVLKPSDTKSTCPWKGEAHYYSIEVDGKLLDDAAWYYPETSDEAKQIKGYVAFWRGVEISD